jgi:RNA polymerase sigma-70 factor, ECF subfamily
MDELDDRELAKQAGAGSREAFGALYMAHKDYVYRVAYRMVGERVDAEDILQDVFVKLAKSIRTYRGDASFKTWLFDVVHSVATDHIRRRKKLMSFTTVEEPGSNVVKITPIDPELRIDLREAIRSLPPRMCQIVLLHHADGLKLCDIAAQLDISENTVAWNLHEARKRLRGRITDGMTSWPTSA